MKLHLTDLMEKVWLIVITQIKTLGDAIGMIWKKGYFGGGVIFSLSYCKGYHDYDCNIYSKLFSIKHYLVHILAKFWVSNTYIKCISTLQTSGHSQN